MTVHCPKGSGSALGASLNPRDIVLLALGVLHSILLCACGGKF